MKTAMILAAGRGERLKPYTNHFPKALYPIKGKPVIEHQIQKLVEAGIETIVINHAYLGGKIRRYLGHGDRWGINIAYSPEPPGGLETGGGIVNALPLLGQSPFLVINADIFTDFPFQAIKCCDLTQAHLVLTYPPASKKKGDFGLDNNGYLTNAPQDYTFTGIARYHPDFFSDCPVGNYSLTPLLRKMASRHKISGELYEGHWQDIGVHR